MSKFPPKKPVQTIFKAAPKLNWSEFQKNIFRDIAKGEGHTIVEAYAGASKTTSIVESFKYVPKGKKTIALAFNKIIQEELKSRSPSYVEIFTFHSLGFRAIKQRFGNVELDDYKVSNLIKDQLDKNTSYDLINNIADTVAFCKYGLLDTPNQIDKIIDDYSIDLCDFDRGEFIKIVCKTLGQDKAITNKIDFNDMCWLPFIYNLSLGQYDFVYADEAQDLNKSQLVMAKKACKPSGRIVMVLDPNQALYSWRMADTSVLEDLKKQDKTKILPLPISYRCPKKVIELAQHWVPDITCPPTTPEGEVHDISLDKLYSIAKPGCFILSRTNAPMIKICMNFIRNNIPANIRGRDVGKQLSATIKKSKKKQIPAFLKWLENWKDEEVARLQEKKINTDNVLDRYECLTTLCEEHKTLDEVLKKIDKLFDDTDQSNIIILSTVHRAKGLERDNVFILRWTFRQWLEENLQFIEKPNEEANIAYVAATRAKKSLYIVRKAP
jgi:DNA helicase-2/ATP-dependent DNA helicase PcrA